MRRFQPALLGGLFIGVVSALPVVGAANACCCLWVVLGGLITVYLQRQAHPEALEAAEAVLGGLIAGLVGAIIYVVITGLIVALSGARFDEQIRVALDQNAQLPSELRDRVETVLARPNAPLLIGVFYAMITIPMYAVFSMLGALLGLALFRRKPAPPPQV
jgi:hypothetical protein